MSSTALLIHLLRASPSRTPTLLQRLPDAAVHALLEASTPVTYSPFESVLRPGTASPPGVLAAGRLRIYAESADGRQATIGYPERGDSVGLAQCFYRTVGVAIQAITEATVLHFDCALLKQLLRDDPGVALGVATVLAAQIQHWTWSLYGHALGSGRERLALQLLALGQRDASGTRTVRLTNQELADAVGVAREHLTRLLRDLRSEGLVSTSRGAVRLLDEAGLKQEAARLLRP